MKKFWIVVTESALSNRIARENRKFETLEGAVDWVSTLCQTDTRQFIVMEAVASIQREPAPVKVTAISS